MKKTVIYDLNNLAVRCFFSSDVGGTTENPEFDLWKFRIVEIIYDSIKKFKPITEVILAIDDKDSWRKVLFPRYKESRKKKRNEDDVDWKRYYTEYEDLQNIIKNSLPFKCIKSSRSEADDVIGILSRHIQNKVVVVSNDSDYLQLCDTKKIQVWNPTNKEFSKLKETREEFVNKLLLMGQKKDDIFNTNTPSDYPLEYRKPPLGDKGADKIIKEGLDKYLDTEKKIEKIDKDEDGNEIVKYLREFKPRENYERNQKLIDFYHIPDVIKQRIISDYEGYELPDPNKIYEFFKVMGWNGFLDNYEKVETSLMELYGGK